MIITIIITMIITIIISSRGPEPSGWLPVQYNQVLQADEALVSLGWQSSRNGVLIEIPVVVQRKIH